MQAARARTTSLTRTAARRLPALAHARFRRYALGVVVADGAVHTFQLTAAWLVYELARPPLNVAFVLGVLGFCRTVPMLVFVLGGGVAADRLGRRRMLLLSYSASAAIAALFAAITFAGLLTVWGVLVMAVLMGSAMAFNRPAHHAFIRDLVPAGEIQSAVALLGLTQNVIRIVAPLAAGLLLARGGGGAALALVSCGYGLMALNLATIRVSSPPRPGGGLLSSLGEALRYVRHEPDVRALLLLVTIPGFFALPYMALLPIFADGVYGRGAAGLGTMQAAAGMGALCGALVLTLLSGFRRRGLLLLTAISGFGLALVVLALVEAWPVALAALFVAGMTDMLYVILVSGLLLTHAPEHLRGRVMSLFTFADIGMTPLGSLAVGTLAGLAGAQTALAATGSIVVALVSGTAGRSRRLRRMT